MKKLNLLISINQDQDQDPEMRILWIQPEKEIPKKLKTFLLQSINCNLDPNRTKTGTGSLKNYLGTYLFHNPACKLYIDKREMHKFDQKSGKIRIRSTVPEVYRRVPAPWTLIRKEQWWRGWAPCRGRPPPPTPSDRGCIKFHSWIELPYSKNICYVTHSSYSFYRW